MGAKTAPKGLDAKGRRLWRDITGQYELRKDELRVLEDACREADLIERLQGELDGREGEPAALVVKGSMGQPVASPLVQEVRQHRTVLARLLGSLKLPDEPDETPGARSSSAREAAMARWHRGA